MRRRGRTRSRKGWLIVPALGLAGFLALGAFRAGARPAITIRPDPPVIGRKATVSVEVSESRRGLLRVRVEIAQGGRTAVLAEKTYVPRPPWALWGARVERDSIRVEAGRAAVGFLEQGEASIRVTAERAPAWLRAPAPAVGELKVPVRLIPPSLERISPQVYVRQGGSEAVVYRVGETAVRHGVRAGEWFFPGYPLPGAAPGTCFALFAVPYDQPDASKVRLVASDEVDNEASLPFVDRFFPQPLRADTIHLDDAFMSRVVPTILSRTPELDGRSSLLDGFLVVNGELRRRNNGELVELAKKSSPRFLWSRPFLPLAGSQVMARFADRRTYVYGGRVVDRQDHLGLDLARTAASPVPAANDGRVVLARYLGIYGNAVVVDHGYGLMSLYGHLSAIHVKEGDPVRRGQVIGRTGDTGLAGGDHLHFAILLHGLPVSPIEWWDPHWLGDRLARKLGRALPLGG